MARLAIESNDIHSQYYYTKVTEDPYQYANGHLWHFTREFLEGISGLNIDGEVFEFDWKRDHFKLGRFLFAVTHFDVEKQLYTCEHVIDGEWVN